MRRHTTPEDKLVYLWELIAVWGTWLIVIGLPVAGGYGLHAAFPRLWLAVPVLLGVILFAVLLFIGEWIHRNIRDLLTRPQPDKPFLRQLRWRG